jgi:hypothetical protein
MFKVSEIGGILVSIMYEDMIIIRVNRIAVCGRPRGNCWISWGRVAVFLESAGPLRCWWRVNRCGLV